MTITKTLKITGKSTRRVTKTKTNPNTKQSHKKEKSKANTWKINRIKTTINAEKITRTVKKTNTGKSTNTKQTHKKRTKTRTKTGKAQIHGQWH